ncbi:MAG: glutaredoxin family protein [Candidatus Pacebacteria bacterium]|nr:glutaredoxin family protein [Candidatus Paceibacterota bacterium]MBP9842787.1 glutaredoxin family protein [Candidatus Paceibacterota bacterium]
MRKIASLLALFPLFFISIPFAQAQEVLTPEPVVIMFGRDDCGFCKEQFKYLYNEDITYEYLNIVKDDQAKALYDQLAEKHDISKVTPVTVVGETVLVGFNGEQTTGKAIKDAIERAKYTDIRTIEDHLARAPKQDVVVGGGCSGLECDTNTSQFVFDLPFLGVVDLQTFSLFTLSAVLGVIDGFNPCAMWVLITFLTLLSQAGSKKKMIFLAGIFIIAEAVMYNMILNVWYKTWDFVALDRYVTPLVGLLSLGGAIFFLWRWHKNKEATLVCDITDLDTQMKTISKFQAIINQPITLASIAAILVIAFSVNIIEFACSIGIPQAYTKILEINMLSALERQWYILVYTIGYMVDDFVVFGLAIWGYSKLQSHGGKYAQLSLLIGGILMFILGLILVIDPTVLIL